MADLSSKKSNYLSKLVSFADTMLSTTRMADEIHAYALANGFLTAGANAIVDADCVGANAHLTAASVNATDTIAGQLSTAVTTAMRNNLRAADITPQG